VRSGLSGAADVDLDGKVTYPELGAFIAAASGEIKDPRARVDVTVSPPPAQLGAALSDRSAFVPSQVVYLDPKLEGHFAVETPDGERLVDLHKPKGAPAILALWGAQRYFLLGAAGESLLDFTRRKVVAALAFTPARKSERGSVEEEYRRALFARAFDFSYYRAWCSLQRLPAPAAPASSPGLLELGAADPVEAPTTPATTVAVRPPVAVLYFDYEGYDDDLTQLRKGLAQMLVTDLVAAGVRVVERERLQEVLEELRLNQTASVNPATANRVGRLLGARHLVMGHFLESQGTMMVTARVVETETGEIVGESKVAGKPEEFFLLEEQMAAELARGIGRLAPLELPAVPAKPKPKAKPTRQAVKAVAQLGRALEALDEKDAAGARKTLKSLLKRHPDFAVAAQQLARLE
jgi:TolB-like protein